jgi:hypothetical protein
MKKVIIVPILMVLGLFLIYSCEKETISFKQAEVPGQDTVKVSFKNEIVPVFQNKCISCHGTSSPILNLQTNVYQNLVNAGLINTSAPSSSGIYEKLHSTTSSHAGKTTPAEQALILKWIEQGAKNN